jgi:hypothetical protein
MLNILAKNHFFRFTKKIIVKHIVPNITKMNEININGSVIIKSKELENLSFSPINTIIKHMNNEAKLVTKEKINCSISSFRD